MIIRPTQADDRQFLIRFFDEPKVLEGFPMSTEKEIEDSSQFWVETALKGTGLTCVINQKIAGMAVLYIPVYDKLHKAALFSLVVAPEFRRQKIGTHLIEALETLGKNKYGLTIVHLEVYEKNFPAIKLYESLGYRQYGIQKNSSKTAGNISVKSSWKSTSGKVYNLKNIFDELNGLHFSNRLQTTICWARQSPQKLAATDVWGALCQQKI